MQIHIKDDLETIGQYLVPLTELMLLTFSGGYGVYNVQQRIQPYYGEEYGLTIGTPLDRVEISAFVSPHRGMKFIFENLQGMKDRIMKQVCIVGYGAIGPSHARALETVNNAKLYAVCDIKADKRALCAQKYGVLEYDDFETMLKDDQVDTVHICTLHYLHFQMVKKALAAGKDVVVEKPVTMTKAEFEELRELPGSERVCAVFQNRLNPCMIKLKQLVQNGTLGGANAARAVLTWNRERAYYSDDWHGKIATEGGGLLINQAIHTLDYFCYLFGKPEIIQTQMSNLSLQNIIEVEDTVAAYLRFQNGMRGIFFGTNAYGENASPFFEVSFEKGMARYTDKKLWINDVLVEEDNAASTGKAYWGNGHVALLQRYYDEHKHFSIKDIADTMETVFEMYDKANMHC